MPPLAEQLYRQTCIESSNGLKIQMDRANIWGNGLWGRKCDACRFFRECGLPALGQVHTLGSVGLRGALVASSCHGFMPYAKRANPEEAQRNNPVSTTHPESKEGSMPHREMSGHGLKNRPNMRTDAGERPRMSLNRRELVRLAPN